MKLESYLFLEGRAEEAIAFYKQALGAEVTAMMRMEESPEPAPPGMMPPGSEKKIMHANLKIGDMQLMLSDGMVSGKPEFKGMSLTLSGLTVAEAKRIFAALSDGGTVRMPLAATFFSPSFGMLADRFGVPWMVMADPT